MSKNLRHWPIPALLLAALACATSLTAKAAQDPSLDRQFQSAVAQYDAGHFAEAATQLEALLPKAPESFEVHELLGLVYSSLSQDAKANIHLQKAVRLQPKSAAARTNLAANLMRLGKLDLAEESFKKAVDLEPANFDANHDLGEFYIHAGKVSSALPYLLKAQQVNPASYDNGYDLALANLTTGHIADARQQAEALLKQKDTAELHDLLGDIEEQDGQFVAAANQYQTAVHMDPSESNLFDLGSELLLHRTLEPAITVFQQASEKYPDSARIAIGLGMAYYALGKYDEAVKSLLRAADINPSDPRCYFFLSKAYDSSPTQADAVIQRFKKFADLQPTNARAFYYYAMSLWKGKRTQDSTLDLRQIESLLKKSLELDPSLPEARLQLGNLYSDQGKYAVAIPEYERTLQLNADLADAHYRLGQALVRTGEKDRAQEQFDIYQKIRARNLADLEKQRAEIRQFVISAKDNPTAKP